MPLHCKLAPALCSSSGPLEAAWFMDWAEQKQQLSAWSLHSEVHMPMEWQLSSLSQVGMMQCRKGHSRKCGDLSHQQHPGLKMGSCTFCEHRHYSCGTSTAGWQLPWKLPICR